MDVEVIIIGAGAAGLMAAFGAASVFNDKGGGARGKVLLLEKMPRPGRKLMITGKGRCNYTNMKAWSDFSAHIRTDKTFVRPSFYNLSPEKLTEFFECHGLKTIVERGDRAYPASYKSSDVIDTLCSAATAEGASIECGAEVHAVNPGDDGYTVQMSDGTVYHCKALIIATGGLSYPSTGSTGDGYSWAEKMDHSVKLCFPSLTAMVPEGYKEIASRLPQGALKGHIDRTFPLSGIGSMLCGISLKNISAALYNGSDLVQSEFGELCFTDGGIEGPVGFTLSRNCVKALMNGGHVKLVIDLKPGIRPDELLSRINTLKGELEGQKDALGKLLRKLLPADLIAAFVQTSPALAGRSFSSEQLCHSLKDWTFNIVGYVGYERCVVTAGGVNTKEVVPKTMQSRLNQGLYFCGEVLDIDCDTGGYNLQCAFSTGFLAGQSAAIDIIRNK